MHQGGPDWMQLTGDSLGWSVIGARWLPASPNRRCRGDQLTCAAMYHCVEWWATVISLRVLLSTTLPRWQGHVGTRQSASSYRSGTPLHCRIAQDVRAED